MIARLQCITLNTLISLLALTASATVQADPFNWDNSDPACHSNLVLHAGVLKATYGATQTINTVGLVGDTYTVSNRHPTNALIGLGYYRDALDTPYYRLQYGLDAFYFPNNNVQGNIIQEQLFTNLSYQYTITNYPVYLAAKGFIKNSDGRYDISLDLGVGPNFIYTSQYTEQSLDGGMTLPNNAFAGQTSVSFSATAGIGIRVLNGFVNTPCELSYRFFYLGQGKLNKKYSETQGTLKTGYNYENTLIFSLYL